MQTYAKKKMDPPPHTINKTNFKWITDLNVIGKTVSFIKAKSL